ncbi:MAG: glucosamine-6-phosphate deaminase [Planctomycetaceae bacterium]|jgi:glucosamine-6-phosphate deaminase|nr:glucosamine-6-phosphate deaminase [Planctomycetaceae bacterium]
MFRKKFDQLVLEVYQDRRAAGHAAGILAAEKLKTILAEKNKASVVFAAAPSQNETLETLVSVSGIDWNKVTAFHMDEYIGLPDNASERFSFYLKTHIFDKCSFAAVHLLSGNNPQLLCQEYAQKLVAEPIDLICMGIGENGHIAFNDPPVADFNDPQLVKIVELDLLCRQQQVHDGCFPNLDAVPKQAVTLTIPALMSGGCLICTVLGQRKRSALHRMISGNISTECPATILRTHKDCTVFVDQDCYMPADDFLVNS